MRGIVALGLVASLTGCSFFLTDTPGPDCEETGADIADGTTAVVTGLLTLIVAGAVSECFDGCGGDELQAYGGALGLTAATVGFTAGAVRGSRYNAACRKARGQPTDP